MTARLRYTVTIKRSAEREMDALPRSVFERVVEAVLALESDPRARRCKKLRGVNEYRLRVGAYRILYTIDDEQRAVDIVSVGHRRDVYRDT